MRIYCTHHTQMLLSGDRVRTCSVCQERFSVVPNLISVERNEL